MRRLKKAPPPGILLKNALRWTKEFIRAKRRNQVTDTMRFRYRHPDIKEALLAETDKKCVYCESYFRAVAPGQTDHLVPVSVNERLICCWHNLTIACEECNRRKGDYCEPGSELLNPYEDDVEDSLLHLGGWVFHKPGHERAEITVRKLEFNKRVGLMEEKMILLGKVQALADKAVKVERKDLRDMLVKELNAMALPSAEYSAAVRTLLTAMGIPHENQQAPVTASTKCDEVAANS